MALRAAALSLALALPLPRAAADGLSAAAPGCPAVLRDIAALGHSDLELAAYCRANMPAGLCRDASRSLGSQPWPSDRIDSTCRAWEEKWSAAEEQAPGRGMMDFAELQRRTDQCVQLKAKAGLCRNPKTGKPLPLDACVRYKQHVYPEQTKKIHDLVKGFYAALMGQQQKSELVGRVAASGAAGVGLYAGMACAAAALAAAAAGVTFARFWRRGRASEHRLLLVEGSPEGAAPADA